MRRDLSIQLIVSELEFPERNHELPAHQRRSTRSAVAQLSKVNPLSREAAYLELATLAGQQSSSCLSLNSLSERLNRSTKSGRRALAVAGSRSDSPRHPTPGLYLITVALRIKVANEGTTNFRIAFN